DPRSARMLNGAEFEMVRSLPEDLRITHAIFDHDGTISTLRQGWEEIMEPMMVRAILGPKFETADESLYHTVVDRSRDYIDKSTGIQTLVQMQGLVQLVREFGCVPDDQILDENGYKTIYNDALLEMVNGRVRKLRAGELSIEDFTIKNAPLLLEKLASAGVKLYLASGTDEADVKSEAEALGYSDLFEGRIYGAVGDVTKEAKRIVLDRILNDVADQRGLVTFGDGPVEMRETRKRGGLAVGIASDEVRRYGSNSSKRSRLIRSGADVIVPDFSQLDRLLEVLNIETVDKQTTTTV
ncbi:MAG: HAD family hydrolase, partial [Armatimonadota bacterium]